MQTHKIPSLYLDTSVIGGYFDEEFKDATRELWRQMGKGLFRFYTSQVSLREVARAPFEVRELLSDTFSNPDSILDLNVEAGQLAQAYMKAKVVPGKYADDADHVAIAVVHQINLVVSWNFKHLVNFRRESGFNAVNLLQNYPPVRILSPLELIYGS